MTNAEKPRPLYRRETSSPLEHAMIGRLPEYPLTPHLGSAPEEVAKHAIRIGRAQEVPIWFEFNQSIFKVEIVEGRATFSIEKIDSNSADYVQQLLNTFNSVAQSYTG